STLRSPNFSRQRQISLATLSERGLPFHKWTGRLALVIVVIHIVLVLQSFRLELRQFKQARGLFPLYTLIFLLLFGWLCWYRSTVRSRYIHLTLEYIIICIIFLHVII